VDGLLAQFLPTPDLAVLLVNDPLYGGAGGSLLIASRSASAPKIVRHEAGHALAGLGDEYEGAYPGYPDIEEPNTTRETRPEFIKWKAWIAPATPLPTPPTAAYQDAVGLFEGAHYHETGWYRPKLDCKMRTLGMPFCEVCQEALMKSIFARVSPIDAQIPAAPAAAAFAGHTLRFALDLVQPQTHSLLVSWLTNGVQALRSTNSQFSLAAAALGPGQHTVRALAADPTAWVRHDPSNLLQRAVSWTVQVETAELRLQPLAVSGGSFSVFGPGANVVVIEAADVLPHWRPVLTNRLVDGRMTFSDATPWTSLQRFYRAVMPDLPQP